MNILQLEHKHFTEYSTSEKTVADKFMSLSTPNYFEENQYYWRKNWDTAKLLNQIKI